MENGGGTPHPGPTTAAAVAYPSTYSTLNLKPLGTGTGSWHNTSAGKPQLGTQGPVGPLQHTAAPAVHGEDILSAGHRPALDDSRDGTPSQSVTGQEMLPQLPADVSL